MKKLSVAMVALAVMIMGAYAADTVTSVNVVGVYNLEIAAGGSSSPTYTFMSLPMTRLPVARGIVSVNTATTISDSGASWSANQFAPPSGEETYFVEVYSDGPAVSNVFEGRHFYITGNTSDTLTFDDPGDLAADNLNGLNFKVIPATRIADAFGAADSPVLKSGDSAANADTILLWDGTTWSAPIYHYVNPYQATLPSPNHNHWVQGASIADNSVIDRDVGFVVKRSQNEAAVPLTTSGEVSGNDQSIVLSSGYELVGGMSSVDEVISLANLKSVLEAGDSAANADTISEWAGSSWGAPVYYYINPYQATLPSPNHDHWVQGSEIVDDTFQIQAGKAYLIKKQSGDTWVRSSPL